jgi:hypothetical protein
MVDTLCSLADGGSVSIYAGTCPVTPETDAGSAALATLSLSSPAFGSAVGGVATAEAITDATNAPGEGDAGWFRVFAADDTPLWDGTIGIAGADLNLNTLSVEAGDTVRITAFTVTLPQP